MNVSSKQNVGRSPGGGGVHGHPEKCIGLLLLGRHRETPTLTGTKFAKPYFTGTKFGPKSIDHTLTGTNPQKGYPLLHNYC